MTANSWTPPHRMPKGSSSNAPPALAGPTQLSRHLSLNGTTDKTSLCVDEMLLVRDSRREPEQSAVIEMQQKTAW